jgi:hypothetical protein
MGLLMSAKKQTAFLKAGLFGFAGSGKTRTGTELAIGLCGLEGAKTAAFFDSEGGSDYVAPLFDKAGVELLVHKGRAFKDLLAIIKECEQGGIKVLLIDSISHVWRDLMESYVKKFNRRNGLQFQDWGVIKAEWQQFSDAYLNSKIHIIMCGRAGFEYDYQENENTGKKELIKAGTKMKVETELGFEPSLLIEMESIDVPGSKKIINRAFIIKDRTDKMNGNVIDMPTFEHFMPVISFLNIGGEHAGVNTTNNSQEIFEDPDKSWHHEQKQREIALEELAALLVRLDLSGTSKEAQKDRLDALEFAFNTVSKSAIEAMRSTAIREGLVKIGEWHKLRHP